MGGFGEGRGRRREDGERFLLRAVKLSSVLSSFGDQGDSGAESGKEAGEGRWPGGSGG